MALGFYEATHRLDNRRHAAVVDLSAGIDSDTLFLGFFYLKLSCPELFVCKTCFNWLIKQVQPRSSGIFSKH